MLHIFPIAFQQDDPHLVNLILKAVVAAVFVLMNILYLMFWKNGKQDFFEALPEEKQKLILQAKEEYAPTSERPMHCHCGYDLRVDPARWVSTDIEIPSRCPECCREIVGDERDAPAVFPEKKPALVNPVPALIEIVVSSPEIKMIEPAVIGSTVVDGKINVGNEQRIACKSEPVEAILPEKTDRLDDVIGLVM